jgi:hypothetical protein
MASTLARFESSGYLHLWGYQKTLVYAGPADTREALHRRVVDACKTTPTSLNRRGGPWWDVSRRALNLI